MIPMGNIEINKVIHMIWHNKKVIYIIFVTKTLNRYQIENITIHLLYSRMLHYEVIVNNVDSNHNLQKRYNTPRNIVGIWIKFDSNGILLYTNVNMWGGIVTY